MKRSSIKKILEENVVLCDKKAAKNSVSIWVVADPKIRVEAGSLAKAEELLVDKIWDTCELDEPFAIKYQEESKPEARQEDKLIWVSSNDLIDTGNPSEYFKGGFCSTCQEGIGGRNGGPLKLEKVPKALKSGFTVRYQGTRGLMMRKLANIIHKDICQKISEVCRPLVEFRQVMDLKRGPTDFFEVVPIQNFLEVSPAGQENPGGQCVDCRSVRLYGEVGKSYLKKSDADIIRRHGVAAIGNFAPMFCVSSRVWDSLKKVETARRLLKIRFLMELEDSGIEPNPKFTKILP